MGWCDQLQRGKIVDRQQPRPVDVFVGVLPENI
jgi:hypothetical protein